MAALKAKALEPAQLPEKEIAAEKNRLESLGSGEHANLPQLRRSLMQLCRAGQANPDLFGVFDMHGMWFIRGNVVRDLAALNKVELLPWDCWASVGSSIFF